MQVSRRFVAGWSTTDRRRSFPGSRLLLAVLVLSLGGCRQLTHWAHNGFKVGPDYCPVAGETAEHWIDDDAALLDHPRDGQASGWWSTFEDPLLADLLSTVHRDNIPLRVAALRVLEADAQRRIANGQLFPQFQEAFASFEQRQRSRFGWSSGLPDATRSLGVWTAGLNASWEWDIWGRIRRSITSAEAKLEASAYNYDDVLLTLTADTAATYFELRSFQKRLVFNQANVKRQRASLALAQKRFENGIVTKLDVTQAETSLHQTLALRPVLQRGLRLANNRLCVLLGRPPTRLHDLLDSPQNDLLPTPPRQVVVGIPADLLRRRPDVRRAERLVAAQSERIGIAAAALFPSFSIGGSINWQAESFGDLFAPAANAGSMGPRFQWNILNYNRIANAVAAEDARWQQLAAEYQQAVLEANREAEDAIVEFLRAGERADELKLAATSASESLELAQVHYAEGWIDFDRVNNLQRDLARQQDLLVASQADVLFGLIRIFRALGGGWSVDQPWQAADPPAKRPAEALPLPSQIHAAP